MFPFDDIIMHKASLSDDSPEPIESFEWLLENHDTGTMERERKAAQEDSSWIRDAIQCRQCPSFFPKPGSDICHCGRNSEDHEATDTGATTPRARPPGPWNYEHDTVTAPTNAYGHIQFEGHPDRIIKFVRLDYQTPMRTVQVLLQNAWSLQRPNLLISVTGGAKRLTLNPRLNHAFKDGLVRAAASTGAWIITAGTCSGVVKVVGEALHAYEMAHGQKSNVVLFGIAPWGLVKNRDCLVDDQGSWPAFYSGGSLGRAHREFSLDPHHTHFVLVDDGTVKQFTSVEASFRAQVESAISKIGTLVGYAHIKVPLVSVVLEGGPGTLEAVENALKVDTTVVIIGGSGRASDVLALAYELSSDIEPKDDEFALTDLNPDDQEDLTDLIRKVFGEQQAEECLNCVLRCMNHREHMSIFRMDYKNHDIDGAILRALLKEEKFGSMDKLRLALAWNRVDIAREHILPMDSLLEENLEEALHLALLDNKVDFVKLILNPVGIDISVDLKRFLTIERLVQLYNGLPPNTVLEAVLKKVTQKSSLFNLEDIGKVMRVFLGDFYCPLYLKEARYRSVRVEHSDTEVGGLRCEFAPEPVEEKTVKPNNQVNGTTGIKAEHVSPLGASPVMGNKIGPKQEPSRAKSYSSLSQHNDYDFDNPCQELFFWAVLIGNKRLAKLFWNEGKLGMAGAVIAERMFSSLMKHTSDAEQQNELQEAIKDFEEIGVGVLSHCHARDEQKAAILLIREMPQFGGTTVLHMVAQAELNFNFITHAAAQALVTNIWMGRLSTDTGRLKIIVSALIPPLCVFLRYTPCLWLNFKKGADTDVAARGRVKVVDKPSGDEKIQEKRVPVWKRPWYFFRSPCVLFVYHQLAYLSFLLLFGIMMMTNFHPDKISVMEYIVYVYVLSLFCEEIRQFFNDTGRQSLFRTRIRKHFREMWNILDMLAQFVFVMGLVLRFIPDNADCFKAARVMWALSLIMFWCRLLQSFTIDRNLGPKLVMIGRMLVDLLFFVLILLVFVIAFGLAMQIILYPNAELDIMLMRDVVRKSYWQIYGELFLDELEGEIACTDNPTIYKAGTLPRCPEDTWIVPILLGIYIMFANVLMLNLLIAMFSYTFDKVQTKTDLHWFFQRYFLVKEYARKPGLVPPFILISHGFFVIYSLCLLCCKSLSRKKKQGRVGNFRVRLNPEEDAELSMWERVVVNEYIREINRAKSIQRRAQENERQTLEKVDVIEKAVASLESQVKQTSLALNWMMSALQGGGMSAGSKPPLLKRIKTEKDDRDTIALRTSTIMQRQVSQAKVYHLQARFHSYPVPSGPPVIRAVVPDEKVPWETTWEGYSPPYFTSDRIKKNTTSADPEIPDPALIKSFNTLDHDRRVDRRSHCGVIKVVGGLPLNPEGRSGLMGRGLLYRWGPNHAVDPVITRWKKNSDGHYIMQNKRPVLEFVAVKRVDSGQWAIPGGYIFYGTEFLDGMRSVLLKKTMPEATEEQKHKLDRLIDNGIEVFRGYSDDSRNTDNAWVETICWNFHDETGDLVKSFPFSAGRQVNLVSWMKLSSGISLFAGHLDMLQKVAEKHQAAF